MRIQLIAAAAALTIAANASADREVTHAFSSSAPRAAIRRVIIAVPAGEVKIRNGAADRISVSGDVRRSYEGWSQREKQQRIADDVTVEIYVNGDQAVVRRHFGPHAQSWSARSFHSNLDAGREIDPDVEVILETKYGEVDIDGSFGNVECDLRAGEIRVRTPHANVRELTASVRAGEVRTNLGGEILTREGLFPGRAHYLNAAGKSDVRVHTTFGEVRVTLTR